MSLIGYARVSTDDQSVDAQRDALERAGCGRIFADEGVSGMLRDRPQLAAALDYVRPGDTLVVMKLDRAGRSFGDLLGLMKTLEEKSVAFHSLTEAIDTGTASGKLLLHILGAIAEFERELIVERTRAGLRAARERGHTGGRPVQATAEKLAAARALLSQGATIDAAARAVGLSRRTLYRHGLASLSHPAPADARAPGE